MKRFLVLSLLLGISLPTLFAEQNRLLYVFEKSSGNPALQLVSCKGGGTPTELPSADVTFVPARDQSSSSCVRLGSPVSTIPTSSSAQILLGPRVEYGGEQPLKPSDQKLPKALGDIGTFCLAPFLLGGEFLRRALFQSGEDEEASPLKAFEVWGIGGSKGNWLSAGLGASFGMSSTLICFDRMKQLPTVLREDPLTALHSTFLGWIEKSQQSMERRLKAGGKYARYLQLREAHPQKAMELAGPAFAQETRQKSLYFSSGVSSLDLHAVLAKISFQPAY